MTAKKENDPIAAVDSTQQANESGQNSVTLRRFRLFPYFLVYAIVVVFLSFIILLRPTVGQVIALSLFMLSSLLINAFVKRRWGATMTLLQLHIIEIVIVGIAGSVAVFMMSVLGPLEVFDYADAPIPWDKVIRVAQLSAGVGGLYFLNLLRQMGRRKK